MVHEREAMQQRRLVSARRVGVDRLAGAHAIERRGQLDLEPLLGVNLLEAVVRRAAARFMKRGMPRVGASRSGSRSLRRMTVYAPEMLENLLAIQERDTALDRLARRRSELSERAAVTEARARLGSAAAVLRGAAPA